MRVIFFTMFTSYLNAYTFYHFLGDTSKKRAFFSTLLPHLDPIFTLFFPHVVEICTHRKFYILYMHSQMTEIAYFL